MRTQKVTINNQYRFVVKKTIQKVKKGEIALWGPDYNCKSEGDFDTKLHQFVLVSNEIKLLDLEIKTSIARAIEGNNPDLLIQLDDVKLNLDVYQQIMSKVYAGIRYQVYQRIKTKLKNSHDRRSKSDYIARQKEDNDIALLIVDADDIQDLIKELDIEAIRK